VQEIPKYLLILTRKKHHNTFEQYSQRY